jgi:hypothetical protein
MVISLDYAASETSSKIASSSSNQLSLLADVPPPPKLDDVSAKGMNNTNDKSYP